MENNANLFRCKCGRTRIYAFVQPPVCQPCGWCGTNLASSQAIAALVVSHEMYEEEYVIDEKGTTITCRICKFCSTISPLLDARSDPRIAVIN